MRIYPARPRPYIFVPNTKLYVLSAGAQGFLAFFEFAAQDLARGDLGNGINEFHVVNLFIPRQLAVQRGRCRSPYT